MTRATPPLLKHLNERAVLEAIRGGAPISRAEIARRTGISKPTVSLALRALHYQRARARDRARSEPAALRCTLLRAGARGGARARRRHRHALHPRSARGSRRKRARAQRRSRSPATTSNRPSPSSRRSARSSSTAAGAPASTAPSSASRVWSIRSTESVSLASNALGIEGARLAGRLTDALDVTAQLENDINLAALGEQWRGVARGVDDFLFLSIGTGMGAGLVLRGELHRGRNGAAGELDYAFVGVGTRRRPVRRRGLGVRAGDGDRAHRRHVAAAAVRAAPDLRRRARRRPARARDRRRGGTAHRAARSPGGRGRRRRPRRARRRHRRERRPTARADPGAPRARAPVPTARRGVGTRRGRRADGRARDRRARGTRERAAALPRTRSARTASAYTAAHRCRLSSSTHSSAACAPAPRGPKITVGTPAAPNSAPSVQYGIPSSNEMPAARASGLDDLGRRIGLERRPAEHEPRRGVDSGRERRDLGRDQRRRSRPARCAARPGAGSAPGSSRTPARR